MKILFISPYQTNSVPSQRFRFEQYFSSLRTRSITFRTAPFLKHHDWRVLYQPKRYFPKMFILTKGFVRRIGLLLVVPAYDFIFIHREVMPIGPPWFEFIAAKLFNARIIFDFDDAIWLTDNKSETRFERWIRWRSKTPKICAWSYRVSCGNSYLADYAKRFNSRTVVNPTIVNTQTVHNPELYQYVSDHPLTIGWTGSRTTLKYLSLVLPVIRKLQQTFRSLRFFIIADQKPEFEDIKFDFKEWSEQTEALDLLEIDIGIMPLPDEDWARGKCGFKLIQYLSMEIPAVASPVGVNTEIITDKTGRLASTEAEWTRVLTELLENPELRKHLGKEGRKHIENHYSIRSNESVFFALFT